MRTFLLKVSFFVAPLIILAFGLDYVVSHGLRKTRYADYSVWNDLFDGKVNADLIVLGSSRAVAQASPAILDSALQTRSYNLGCNGYGFRMQLCRYEIFRAHNPKPKVVIQEVDYGTLNDRVDLFEFEQFLPYLDDPTIRNFTQHYRGFDFFDYHLPLAGYYSQYRPLLYGVAEFFDMAHIRGAKSKGYLGSDLPWDGSFEKAKIDFPNGIHIKQEAGLARSFRSYLEACKKEKIQIVMVWMPEYIEGQRLVVNRDSVVQSFRDLSREYDIPFLDYSNDTLCFDKKMFYNSRHLNKTGAERFTRALARDLRAEGLADSLPLLPE